MLGRLTGITYKPLLQFRFDIYAFGAMPQFFLYAKAASLPTISHNTETIPAIGHSIKIKGKSTFEPLQITLYAFEGITYADLDFWMQRHYSNLSYGSDATSDVYKSDMTMNLYGPDGKMVQKSWTLVGAQISEINYGAVDWAVSDLILPTITIEYDYIAPI